ncbi:unnamed protein product [Bursaphelenchus xylophilus]|uniref:(pine wood nematode) hypothetical protein n=1 Tax=Bursaphelenchus xylophilus TaxID=6326 RepID=A0A1I7SFV4_BURXY|nr:unnamed protein product [Bursaphelenchus xylophilus]CAG9106339.1 unnamed protein product [Bursaphelenchus xylophilus]
MELPAGDRMVVEPEPDREFLKKLAAAVVIKESSKVLIPPKSTADFSQCCGYLRQTDVEAILRQSQKYKRIPNPRFFEYFTDGIRYPTSILPIRRNPIGDQVFFELLRGQKDTLLELDLEGNCSLGTRQLLDLLEAHKDNLPHLERLIASDQLLFETYNEMPSSHRAAPLAFGDGVPFADDEADCCELNHPACRLELPEAGGFQENMEIDQDFEEVKQFTKYFPTLRHLRLLKEANREFLQISENRLTFLTRILTPLKELITLELIRWDKIGRLTFLPMMSETLTSLVLYDCTDVHDSIDEICELKNLEKLDIAFSNIARGMFRCPVTTLHKLVSSLPKLKYLDIANTNLSSMAAADDRPPRRNIVMTDVYGLDGLDHQLDFVSVFRCESISSNTKLPAKVICSDMDEEKLLIAMETYMDRTELLHLVLNELYQFYRINQQIVCEYGRGLDLIIKALQRHHNHRAIQIAGTAAIFYIIRNVQLSVSIRRDVVEIMLDAMENFPDETIIVRNCCLAACQLDVPADVAFAYKRMVKVLVHILNNHYADSTTPRVVVYLLNSMACHVEGEHKVEVGNFGAIEAVVDHIRRKTKRRICDEVLEVSWSFLWNVTDETPLNCEMFLRSGGMDLFRRCHSEFSTKKELVRNMMGLVGNIAEVQELRGYLMNDELIRIFLSLLDQMSDGIETSYNSAGVLAQLLSDGIEKWTSQVSRQEVTDKIVKTTQQWPMDSRRFINYRSFKPIIRLIPMFDSYGSQIWALWALANLTTTDGEKYCQFIVKEDGLHVLQSLVKDKRSTDQILELVNQIMNNLNMNLGLPTTALMQV